MKYDMLTLGNNLEQSDVILTISLYFSVEKMNIYKKTKTGGQKRLIRIFAPETGLKGLNYSCFVLSMFFNMVILYQTKLHKFFS